MTSYSTSLKDKNIIVTGANAGIGYVAALDFAKRGANLILACRDPTKAEKACVDIKYESGNENVQVEILDVGSLKSVREFADRIIAKWNRLDILVNNAGLGGINYKKTDEGFESHFVINYLGHYLLTRLLLDLLKKSAPSRVINVSSDAHRICDMNWNDLQYEKSYNAADAYGTSKLAQILSTVEFADRYKDTGITFVSLHPGVVKTSFFDRDDKTKCGMFTILAPCFKCFSKTPEDGAKTTIHCAVSADVPNHNGAYFADSKVAKPKAYATDKNSAAKLWKISADYVGLSEESS